MVGCRYAELLQENRGFTDDELSLFERSARAAYEDFRNKAAASRGLAQEDLETVAQVSPTPFVLPHALTQPFPCLSYLGFRVLKHQNFQGHFRVRVWPTESQMGCVSGLLPSGGVKYIERAAPSLAPSVLHPALATFSDPR